MAGLIAYSRASVTRADTTSGVLRNILCSFAESANSSSAARDNVCSPDERTRACRKAIHMPIVQYGFHGGGRLRATSRGHSPKPMPTGDFGHRPRHFRSRELTLIGA